MLWPSSGGKKRPTARITGPLRSGRDLARRRVQHLAGDTPPAFDPLRVNAEFVTTASYERNQLRRRCRRPTPSLAGRAVDPDGRPMRTDSRATPSTRVSPDPVTASGQNVSLTIRTTAGSPSPRPWTEIRTFDDRGCRTSRRGVITCVDFGGPRRGRAQSSVRVTAGAGGRTRGRRAPSCRGAPTGGGSASPVVHVADRRPRSAGWNPEPGVTRTGPRRHAPPSAWQLAGEVDDVDPPTRRVHIGAVVGDVDEQVIRGARIGDAARTAGDGEVPKWRDPRRIEVQSLGQPQPDPALPARAGRRCAGRPMPSAMARPYRSPPPPVDQKRL